MAYPAKKKSKKGVAPPFKKAGAKSGSPGPMQKVLADNIRKKKFGK